MSELPYADACIGSVRGRREVKECYRTYDKIESVESQLIEARAKKTAIEAEKITGDSIYKVLICFDKLFRAMNEEDMEMSLVNNEHIETVVQLSKGESQSR